MNPRFEQRTEQCQAQEVVTEKKVTEVAVRMEFFGLEFRKTSSVEKQHSKYASQGKTDQQLPSTDSKETEWKAEEVFSPSQQPRVSVKEVKWIRSYLSSESKKDGLYYLA